MIMLHITHQEDSMNTQIDKLERKVAKIKDEISKLGAMRPGSLTKQVRIKDGKPYGEYWQLSYTFAGKGHTVYVPPQLVKVLQAEINTFKKFRTLLDALTKASIDCSSVKIKQAKDSLKNH
jgi:hypothetical protein